MKWLKQFFSFKITQQCFVWPGADRVTVKVLAPITLMDGWDQSFVPVEVGTVLTVNRVPNHFNLTDPWMVLGVPGKLKVGGAERCFIAWVEAKKMEVVSFS